MIRPEEFHCITKLCGKRSSLTMLALVALISMAIFYSGVTHIPKSKSDAAALPPSTHDAVAVPSTHYATTFAPSTHDAAALPSTHDAAALPSTHDAADSTSGVSGKTFSGAAVRTFPTDKRKFQSHPGTISAINRIRRDPWCDIWAVLTTISESSKAVHCQVRLKGWCLVIVADIKSPEEYEMEWAAGEGNDKVVYLSPETQNSMHNDFVDRIPWNHFGRKNIGYLFAMMHGATTIWDFDDDNMLKFCTHETADDAPSIYTAIPAKDVENIEAVEPEDHRWPTYNPYVILGAPTLTSWPRGVLLSDIKEPLSNNSTLRSVTVKRKSIAVLQSLADNQPDVDAIYRITMPMPFSFRQIHETKPLLIPTAVLTPYNAQATLHFRLLRTPAAYHRSW